MHQDLNLKNEVEKVAKRIGALIADDPFPEPVEPENLRSAVRAYPMRGGKRIRPALLLWSCGALGGDPETARFAAAAVEIYHNWTLVHDDIIDCDELRRGIPTTHIELKRHASAAFGRSEDFCGKYGRDFAILAGDIQHGWAVNMLLRSAETGVSPSLLVSLLRRLEESVNRELISGEALDVEFPYRDFSKLSVEQVLKMNLGKTSALLRFAVQCGGAIALGNTEFGKEPLAGLGVYADCFGLAFQLRDDYLDVFGTEKVFGKPLCSDFKESKPTALFLETMRRLPKLAAEEFRRILGLPAYGADEIAAVRDMICGSGADKWLLSRIREYSEKAMENLAALPETKYKELLSLLVRDLLEREV